ncbi:MAG: 3-isopropylmalate dehydrogenase [Cyanothece sp. SIO2G6]|nr:3-isopropylmalate dehydrogenase [Cyanothece sp. SIO2G6]
MTIVSSRQPPRLSDPRTYRVVALPGEGIGPEVVGASLDILQHLAMTEGFQLIVDYGLIGEPANEKFGVPLPDATLALCRESDGILFGSATQAVLLELCQYFDLFANLCPVCPSPHLLDASPLKGDRLKNVDILFVRELGGGVYWGQSGRGINFQGAYGFHTMHYGDAQIRRIARLALTYAQARRGHLTLAHKESTLPKIPWTRLVLNEASAFPSVTVVPMPVDHLAMQLVMQPQNFDVVLAGNLFGDILSDLGGAIAGSMGLLGSASLNADGFGLYEAFCGVAPDMAGQGIANPLGTLAGVMLMLEQWGEHRAVQRLRSIQNKLLAAGYYTPDLCETDSVCTSSNDQVAVTCSHCTPVTTNELVALFTQAIGECSGSD